MSWGIESSETPSCRPPWSSSSWRSRYGRRRGDEGQEYLGYIAEVEWSSVLESGRGMSTPSMVVAGGTGNVGSFIVRALLNAGVQVAVPSRSAASFDGLHAHLAASTDAAALERLYSFVGDVGSEVDASRLHDEIASTLGPPNAIVATLGGFTPAPSLLNASTTDLHHVLQSTLIAHFCTYRAFLPGLVKRGGTYVSINGPLGFAPWKDSASGAGVYR